jgi:hypothetical protein
LPKTGKKVRQKESRITRFLWMKSKRVNREPFSYLGFLALWGSAGFPRNKQKMKRNY